MRNLVKAYRGREERRPVKAMEKWGRVRAKGREHFERRMMLVVGGLMLNLTALSDYFLGVKFSFMKYIIGVPIYLFAGWLCGSWAWSSSEREYQKYLAEGRRQDAPRQ